MGRCSASKRKWSIVRGPAACRPQTQFSSNRDRHSARSGSPPLVDRKAVHALSPVLLAQRRRPLGTVVGGAKDYSDRLSDFIVRCLNDRIGAASRGVGQAHRHAGSAKVSAELVGTDRPPLGSKERQDEDNKAKKERGHWAAWSRSPTAARRPWIGESPLAGTRG